ncbi:MAG: ATP-binding protein, partial [Anaerolineae bacterium]|nr:ATP-binding protein [Anaerolineae bacterium]
DLLDRLLSGDAAAYWVIGNRRIGKTSLLRQLEKLALDQGRLIPIFWDMQGADSFATLGGYLSDAVHERLDQLLAIGLPAEMAREENLFVLLPALRRAARSADRPVLLLCDETEVLIHLARTEPEPAQRLHAELTRGGGLYVVAVSTRRIYTLHEVCKTWPTSPFLAGFDMSHRLGGLDRPSAIALITQAQSEEPVRADESIVETICDLTNCHPYLIQLLCSRIFQPDGSLRPVEDGDLVVDPLLAGFFSNDFSLLSSAEQSLIWTVHEQGPLAEAALAAAVHRPLAEVQTCLREIGPLGYLRQSNGHWMIGNRFWELWLTLERQRIGEGEARGGPTLPRPAATDLAAQLNARRARLVELELIRARDLFHVAPSVLEEIRQTEQEIRRLRNMLEGGK